MTTEVIVLVRGNKECEVKLVEPGGADLPPIRIRPNNSTWMYIHGDQQVTVKEVGDFVENAG